MIITGHDSAKRNHRERTSGLALALQKGAPIYGPHSFSPIPLVNAQREQAERQYQDRLKSLLASSNGEYTSIVGQVLKVIEKDSRIMGHAKEAHEHEFISHRYMQAKPQERGVYEGFLFHLFGKLPDSKKESLLSAYERTGSRSN